MIVPMVLLSAGLRPIVVRGGSMLPILHPGDAIIDRMVLPASLRRGDLVTFPAGAASVTHRVVGMTRRGSAFEVETKGDANRGTERWSVEESQNVGRMAVRVPQLGQAAAFLSSPLAKLGLVAWVLATMFLPAMEGARTRPDCE
jgi:signal peptidase I